MKKELLMMQNVSSLDEFERLDLIRSLEPDQNALEYLKNRLQNLYIEICRNDGLNIIELMDKGLLEGWCWQTTESAIVFFEDSDYIERGNLKFSQHRNYWHSWICFKFNNNFFVFDPCLQILVEQCIFNHVFEVSVEGFSTAKDVRDDLIFRINHPQKKTYTLSKEFFLFFHSFELY